MRDPGPKLLRPRKVVGQRLVFREAGVDDAEFILSLRLDPEKSKFLTPTDPDPAAQQQWLRDYARDGTQVYFIITDLGGAAVGTVRLYDPRGTSFSWGSWILSDKAPPSSAVESTLMVYTFGLACGFDQSHFEVRKDNSRVWQYHERFGAVRAGEDALNYYYTIRSPEIMAALDNYAERIPNGVTIELA